MGGTMSARFRDALQAVGPALALALAVLLILIAAHQREPLTYDEVINVARTKVGFSDYPENVLDYSLRPVFRLWAMLLVWLFGRSLEALWLGAAILSLVTVVVLARVGRAAGGSALATAAPLLYLATPLSANIGGSALPHLPSALPALLATLSIVLWQRGPQDDPRRSRRLVVAAFLLAGVALLTHPTQISLVIALGGVTVGIVVVALVRDGWHLGERTRRALPPVLAGYAALAVVIALTELAYRALAGDGTSDRLLPGLRFTYLNHWVSNVLKFDAITPRDYVKGPSYYLRYLFENHPVFFWSTIVVTALALLRLVRRKQWAADAPLFIPSIVLVLWIATASHMGLCTPRVLVGVTPIATASNLLLGGYLAAALGKPGVRTGLLAVVALAAAVAGTRVVLQDRNEVRSVNPWRRANLVEPYRLLAALPPGDVAFLDEGAPAMSFAMCRYFASATGRNIVKIASSQLTARRRGLSYICTPADQFASVSATFRQTEELAAFRNAVKQRYFDLWVPFPIAEDAHRAAPRR